MLNTILNIGSSALSNFQVALNVTGSNVANVDTDGYCRRTVTFETDDLALSGNSGYGMGVSIQSITRNLNAYLEAQYLESSSESASWNAIADNLSGIESLFNDVDGVGVSSALDDFLTSLSELSTSTTASNAAFRSQVISDAEQLAEMLSGIYESLNTQVDTLNASIENQVEAANSIMQDLALINSYVASQPGNSSLFDQRDQLLRELGTIIDIKVIEGSNGQVTVLTKEGQTLVDGENAYELRVEGPRSYSNLTSSSTFDGEVYFSGESGDEFTIECVTGGGINTGASSAGALATFKVSLDGGKTWITDENGDPKIFTAGDEDHSVNINGVDVWFGSSTDSSTAPATSLTAGDEFEVVPKTGLYWITSTGGEVNITPLANSSSNRISGGSLAGLFAVRDEYIGEYQERLDAFSKSLIWSVNSIHSQGAGLEHQTSALGGYTLSDPSVPLGESDLDFASYMQSGALSFAFYDAATGETLSVDALDFSSVTPGTANFDPAVHSLEDVRDAINASYAGKMSAAIVNGQLQLTAADGVEFEIAEDSAGLMAGLGVNTFFTGSGASDIAVSTAITEDPSRLCAAHVNGSGEVNSGDNANALAMAGLADSTVSFYTANGESQATLTAYLNGLASKVGSDTQSATFSAAYSNSLTSDLNDRRLSVSGVNMDEELTNMMKYQQYYQSAAKLIQTASELFDTVLSLK